MRAVVLGDGIVGLHAMRALADGGHWIRPVSRINLDLQRPVGEEAFLGADLVVNTAAMSDVDLCEERAKEAWRVNAEAAGEIAKAAEAAGARLVHVSSDLALHPVNVYGKSRAAGEKAVRDAMPEATILRVSTVFGPHPTRRDFVKWLLGELREHGSVAVPDDMQSSPSYAPEVGRFIAESAERDLPPGTYHVANRSGISRYEFANLVQRAFGVPGSVKRGKFAEYKGFRAPRAPDTRMTLDVPDWFEPLSLEACLADYAAREKEDAAAKEGMRE